MLKRFENFNGDDDKIWIVGEPSGESLQINRDEIELLSHSYIYYSTKYSNTGFFMFSDEDMSEINKILNKPSNSIKITHEEIRDEPGTFIHFLKNNKIENLINLKLLNCSNNQLTSLDGIENLINFEELDCSRNKLTSLKGIEKLINLKELYCSGNQLTSLKGLENLINLKKLYCSENKFSNHYKKNIKNYCNDKKIQIFI